MNSLEALVISCILLFSVYLGYCLGQGKPVVSIPKRLKAFVRTDEEESAVIDRLSAKKK